ncbi:MerR family transcriptional regulator (plasmid) [Rhizobium leguminosarum]|uniref:MerR family transcriptional regulator n=1 Tax=Rhizobium leguminosarum TaxID=384 RepID=UPI000481BBDF|nr:MerR family transcriptional regulator [Rhizobium leguminosarum]UIK01218.1 MerR family transcriptional regulator [Rhizobium leguminosarum]UIK14136.1 MerR family transcriptional regulator [Rhizobium leguminosarum]UIL30265.1 MerR family transcriptional regulator [Rhizobium leguminosarum]WFT90909.1 MerR family transcriptional regulator [Rhizobium leguminosarum]WFT90958.1 MerR family transcriptional regulator [Rhizobium leguminosarum]
MDHKIQTYRIAEAASLAGVAPSTVRLWEKQGLITPNRSDKGQRLYNAGHFALLKTISSLRKDRGFNPAAILEFLKNVKPSPDAGTPRDSGDVLPLIRTLDQCEEEIAVLKRNLADQTMENQILRDFIRRKL